MYLAFEKINGKTRYFIRESYRQADHFLSRDLIDLGSDPRSYIIYPGGNSFYIDPVVEDRLTDMGTKADPDELEDIFWPFVHPEIRRVLEPFRGRGKRQQANRRKKRPEETIETQLHIFDKRRMHYLRFGQMDQRDIDRLPLKFFRICITSQGMKSSKHSSTWKPCCHPGNIKPIHMWFLIFSNFFMNLMQKTLRTCLSTDKVDAHFIEQVCRLNSDLSFWAGMKTGDSLHNYLVRYVLMYFDHDFAPRSFMEDYIHQFINRHRDHHAPYKTSAFTLKR